MAEVLNITSLRQKLLKIVDELPCSGNVIITKDYKPVALLKCMPDKGDGRLPALLVLGAKKCPDDSAVESIKVINAVSGKNYSKVIFVYGAPTKKFCQLFNAADLRTVYNKKNNLPIITSLKCGITALSKSDKYFVVVFLSQPQNAGTLRLMSRAAVSGCGEIIILRKRNEPIHPIAFSAKYKTILIKTRKELGIPHIIKKFNKEIRYVDI